MTLTYTQGGRIEEAFVKIFENSGLADREHIFIGWEKRLLPNDTKLNISIQLNDLSRSRFNNINESFEEATDPIDPTKKILLRVTTIIKHANIDIEFFAYDMDFSNSANPLYPNEATRQHSLIPHFISINNPFFSNICKEYIFSCSIAPSSISAFEEVGNQGTGGHLQTVKRFLYTYAINYREIIKSPIPYYDKIGSIVSIHEQ